MPRCLMAAGLSVAFPRPNVLAWEDTTAADAENARYAVSNSKVRFYFEPPAKFPIHNTGCPPEVFYPANIATG